MQRKDYFTQIMTEGFQRKLYHKNPNIFCQISNFNLNYFFSNTLRFLLQNSQQLASGSFLQNLSIIINVDERVVLVQKLGPRKIVETKGQTANFKINRTFSTSFSFQVPIPFFNSSLPFQPHQLFLSPSTFPVLALLTKWRGIS